MSKITIVEGNSNDKDNVRVLMVKGEKGDQGDLNHNDIIDNLTSTATNKVLSANQGKVLKDLINKKPYYFNSVAEMKAYDLKVGDSVITLGYYSANDGGGAVYKIKSSSANYYETLNNNLVAELIIDKEVKLKELGAKNNEDVSNILQAAINLCKERYNLIIDDYYILSNKVDIDRPINIKGLPSSYSNGSMAGFNCNGVNNITYFNFNEGAVYCTFENLTFNNNKSGNCIKFSSRDENLTNYRVWKNQFNKCKFNNFDKAIIFYAIGNISDYDYSSEMLFLDCKFYGNNIHCEYNNIQSYNTNFISTDFESSNESIGFLLNSYGGINIDGGSLICKGSLIKLSKNENLNPVNNFIGIVNISNSRFETFTETVFDYTLTERYAVYQQHILNIVNTNFYLHNNGTLIDCNVRGLYANCNISFTGSNKLSVYGRNQQGGSEFSKIFINTLQPEKIDIPFISGLYTPWILLNGLVKLSCVSATNNNNILYYENKIQFGYGTGLAPGNIEISIPWNIRKFVININGAFLGNAGSITITDGDSFTETFTYSGNINNSHKEFYLPYSSTEKTYTITSNNIWGNCYFE